MNLGQQISKLLNQVGNFSEFDNGTSCNSCFVKKFSNSEILGDVISYKEFLQPITFENY